MSGRLFAAILLIIMSFDFLNAFPQQNPQLLKYPAKRFYSWEEAKRSPINSAAKAKYYSEMDYHFLPNRFAYPEMPNESQRFSGWTE